MSVSRIVQNVDNVAVYGNELFSPHAINRNIKKLLENDEALYGFYKDQLDYLKITDYCNGYEYRLGQLVWYRKNGTGRLYLLKNIIDKNTTTPFQLNGKFEKSGWTDEAKYLDVLKYGICCELAQKAIDECEKHESADHPLGKVSTDPDSDDYVDNKVLKTDFSNLDTGRTVNLFPSYMKKMPQVNPVINGTYRRWDCGLVEYDITFRFAKYSSTDSEKECACQVISADCGCPDENTSVLTQEVSANIIKFQSDDDSDISEYFLNINDDGTIFAAETADETFDSNIGRISIKHKNIYVNTYSAVIEFPVKFKNTHYMVYLNNILCEVESGNTVPSSNDLVVCDKKRGSMTILNICYPNRGRFNVGDGYNAVNGGMSANSFHCKVVGECV